MVTMQNPCHFYSPASNPVKLGYCWDPKPVQGLDLQQIQIPKKFEIKRDVTLKIPYCKMKRTLFVSGVHWATLSPTFNLCSMLPCCFICPDHNSACYIHPKALSHTCFNAKISSHRIQLDWLPSSFANSLGTSSNVTAACVQCCCKAVFTSGIYFSLTWITGR